MRIEQESQQRRPGLVGAQHEYRFCAWHGRPPTRQHQARGRSRGVCGRQPGHGRTPQGGRRTGADGPRAGIDSSPGQDRRAPSRGGPGSGPGPDGPAPAPGDSSPTLAGFTPGPGMASCSRAGPLNRAGPPCPRPAPGGPAILRLRDPVRGRASAGHRGISWWLRRLSRYHGSLRAGRNGSGPDRGIIAELLATEAWAGHTGTAGPRAHGGMPDAGPPVPSDAETVLRSLP